MTGNIQSEDALIMERAVSLLAQNRDEEARAVLMELPQDDPIKYTPEKSKAMIERPPRTVREATKGRLEVLIRDGWRCHYCHRRLVFEGVIELIGILCPEQFPFPPGHHMPVGRTHPAANRVYPNADHILAGATGGHWQDLANLVTACTPCNEKKSDLLGWTIRPPERDGWDGITQYYAALVERAPASRAAYHRRKLRELGSASQS